MQGQAGFCKIEHCRTADASMRRWEECHFGRKYPIEPALPQHLENQVAEVDVLASEGEHLGQPQTRVEHQTDRDVRPVLAEGFGSERQQVAELQVGEEYQDTTFIPQLQRFSGSAR